MTDRNCHSLKLDDELWARLVAASDEVTVSVALLVEYGMEIYLDLLEKTGRIQPTPKRFKDD